MTMLSMTRVADSVPPQMLDENRIRQLARIERLRAFNERSMTGAMSAFAGIALLTWVFWTTLGWERAAWWGAAMLTVEAAIFWAGVQCKRALAVGTGADVWGRVQIALAGVAGLCWGSAVWFGWSGAETVHYFLVIMVVVGVAGISMVTMAAYASASALYYAAIHLVPLVHVLTHEVQIGNMIAIGLVTAMVVELGYCREIRMVLLRDVEQSARNLVLVDKLTELLTHDQLTGACSRRHVFGFLDSLVANRARHGTPATLIMFDLDHFKHINDTYGHPTGDRALKEAVRVVHAELRTGDMLGRVGGEEFLVVLPLTDFTAAAPLAERLRQVLAAASIQDGSATIHLPASFGVAELKAAESSAEWFRRVDGALYAAKAKGRNRVAAAG